MKSEIVHANISPALLEGTVSAPFSKSSAHRALICAALCDSQTDIIIGGSNQDIDATVGCLKALGANVCSAENGVLRISRGSRQDFAEIDCFESGSTLRFLLPVAPLLAEKICFNGRGRLPDRPISEFCSLLENHGLVFTSHQIPLTMTGRLSGGIFELSGGKSSQFFSGLLFALPLLEENSEIVFLSQLQSESYVKMTAEVLLHFGVSAQLHTKGRFGGITVPGRQHFDSPGSFKVEGDWSGAAFWLCAGALSEKGVTVTGLDICSSQGDRAIADMLRRLGAEVSICGDSVTVRRKDLRGTRLDLSDTPDLGPPVAALAAFCRGETVLSGVSRLRLKESDRVSAICNMLLACGVSARAGEDEIIINGGLPPHGGMVDGAGDHRIVMAAAILGSGADGCVSVSNPEAVAKSYTGFFKDFCALGGKADVKCDW